MSSDSSDEALTPNNITAEDYAVLERIWFLREEDKQILTLQRNFYAPASFLLDNRCDGGYSIRLMRQTFPIQWVLGTRPVEITMRDMHKSYYFIQARAIKKTGFCVALIVASNRLKLSNQPRNCYHLPSSNS